MTLRLLLALLFLMVLTACGPGYPTIKAPSDERPASYGARWAFVIDAGRTPGSYLRGREEVLCPMSSTRENCFRNRTAYRPEAVVSTLKLEGAGTLRFVDPDPTSFLQRAVDKRVCAYTAEGSFGIAVLKVVPESSVTECAVAEEADSTARDLKAVASTETVPPQE